MYIDSGGIPDDGVYFFIKDVDRSRAYQMDSQELISYRLRDYDGDSESSRLLKRAEFLKAVCEKECVTWLPREKWECCGLPKDIDIVKVPVERDEDCYTKKDINDLLRMMEDQESEWRRALVTSLDSIFYAIKQAKDNPGVGWNYSFEELRRRFLS